MQNWKLFGAVALTAVLMSVPNASANVLTVTNGNSSMTVNSLTSDGTYGNNPSDKVGMNNWTVDGVNQLYQQWFWFREGSAGGEQTIDTLHQLRAVTGGIDNNQIATTYCSTATTGCTDGWEVDVLYTLKGGLAGTLKSDVAETITINNQSGRALDLHFFQYADFDLSGVLGGQTSTFIDKGRVRQTGNGVELNETVVTPQASHYEADLWSATFNKLTDGSPTTLNDSNTSGVGDATWAFQWDVNILNGGTFQISKDKNLTSAVPEPGSILLFGTMLLGCAAVLRRRLS